MALVTQDAAAPLGDDTFDAKDKDFVGVTLGGPGGGGVVSGGELKVDDSCYFEEPRVVADEEDDAAEEERSLWGDGDNDPNDAE